MNKVWIDDKYGQRRRVLECVAVLLVNDEEDRLLTVSRGDKETLPGGKVDPEDREIAHGKRERYTRYAAARELREETGVEIELQDLRLVFEDYDVADHYTATFIAKFQGGTIWTDEKHTIQWSPPAVILDGPFGDYYRRLFEALRRCSTGT